MKTYDELVKIANEYVDRKFPYAHLSPRYDGRDLLSEIMQDGEGTADLDENGLAHTWFFVPSKYEDFASRIDEWSRPIYDDDGDIEDWETVGYDID